MATGKRDNKKTNSTMSSTRDQGHTAYSDDLKKELDNRYEEYKNGGALLTEEEVNKCIEEIIAA